MNPAVWELVHCVHKKMQTNKEKVKHIISWSPLAVIAQVKLKESAGSDLEAGPSSELGQSEPQPLASKPPAKGKIMQGRQKVPLRSPGTTKAEGHQCERRAKPRYH